VALRDHYQLTRELEAVLPGAMRTSPCDKIGPVAELERFVFNRHRTPTDVAMERQGELGGTHRAHILARPNGTEGS